MTDGTFFPRWRSRRTSRAERGSRAGRRRSSARSRSRRASSSGLGAFGQIALIASAYGSSYIADRYFIASIVPLIIGSIAGEALSANILPALVRRDREEELVSGGPLPRGPRHGRRHAPLCGAGVLGRPRLRPCRITQPRRLAGVRPDRRAARPLRLPRQRVDLLRALRVAAVSECRRHGRRVRGHRRRAARDAGPRLGCSCGVLRLCPFLRFVVAGDPARCRHLVHSRSRTVPAPRRPSLCGAGSSRPCSAA